MNGDRDTTLGGNRRGFPTTYWSQFVEGFRGGSGNVRATGERLAASYWKPIYAYIRTKWSKSNDDAKDLTQDFFLWMMESDFVARADPARGRFREFVKKALEHYLSNEQRDRRALKRGGGHATFLLDKELAPAIPDPGGKSPEQVLDEAWRSELLVRAATRLEEVLRGEGKELYFRIFEEYHLSGSGSVSYDELAAKHGLRESDVSNHLMHAKRRFRALLTDLVAETVDGDADLQQELTTLFGVEKP